MPGSQAQYTIAARPAVSRDLPDNTPASPARSLPMARRCLSWCDRVEVQRHLHDHKTPGLRKDDGGSN